MNDLNTNNETVNMFVLNSVTKLTISEEHALIVA